MISILIPIYNGIEFLHEAIVSIQNQTFKEWEIIIGINGYPANSAVFKIAKKFESKNIRVYDLLNIKGKANALNKMLEYCSYDWISLLDVDDKWLPQKLEVQLPYMKDFDVIGTSCEYFGGRTGSPSIPYGDISNYDFKKENPIINSSCLLKKNLCYWDPECFIGLEDYNLWLILRKQNKKFFNVNKVRVLHRIHKESAFNNINAKNVNALLEKHRKT